MSAKRIRLNWEGPILVGHSLGLVNREILLRLAADPDIELKAIPNNEDENLTPADDARFDALVRATMAPDTPADVHVRHEFPLRPTPPANGRWVIMQPWEFGGMPAPWFHPMRFLADEVWVYSSWNRDQYIAAGLPPEKVHVIPLGVHPHFLAEGDSEPFPLRTQKTTRFLFVGGAILRKGIDLLLDAYARAFGPDDDVCLVIKDFGAQTFYQTSTLRETILEFAKTPGNPEVEYLDQDLSTDELCALYDSATCFVYPYRGEGFALPIAEAMARGLPVIVTDQGGASDFAREETAILIPSRSKPAPRGNMDNIGRREWREVDVSALAQTMREMAHSPERYAEMAKRGQEYVRAHHTWDRTADAVRARLAALAGAEGEPLRVDDTAQYSLHMEEGVKAFQGGKIVRAMTEFSIAAGITSTLDAEFNLLACLLQARDFSSALRRADRVLELCTTDADRAEALNMKAVALDNLGLTEEAIDATKAALQFDAGNATATQNLETIRTGSPTPRAAGNTVRYIADLYSPTGYGQEARNFVLGYHEAGFGALRAVPFETVDAREALLASERAVLEALEKSLTGPAAIEIQHMPAHVARPSGARISVLRTMFETDRIASDWAEICNQFNEVWVPSEFNRETFARSGVVAEKIRVVPGAIDTGYWDPARHEPMNLHISSGFKFLAVFDWTERKGSDILFDAFLQEFSRNDEAWLILKTSAIAEKKSAHARLAEYAFERGYKDLSRIVVIDKKLSTDEMASLYRAADAFVLPTRGEGWGYPFMEAMALGTPVIGTRWGAHLSFMNDANSFLIEIDGLESADRQGWDMYRGHLWAKPSLESTRALMRFVMENPHDARRRAEQARADVLAHYDRKARGEQIAGIIREITGLGL